jgi:hypothetical protein
MRSQSEENEIMYTRKILCAIVQQAIEDAQSNPVYLRRHTKMTAENAKNEAIHFIKSKHFSMICNALNLPIDKLKKAAFA